MEWTNLIPWGIALVTLIIGIISFTRTGRKERKAEYIEEKSTIDGIKESLIKANMKLDQLCATTNETRSDIKSMKDYINAMEKRVSVLENNIKIAFQQIEEIREAIKHG